MKKNYFNPAIFYDAILRDKYEETLIEMNKFINEEIQKDILKIFKKRIKNIKAEVRWCLTIIEEPKKAK